MTVVELVIDDDVMDTISLDGDKLVYDTGRAEPIVESVRRRLRVKSNRNVFHVIGDGWTNGYVIMRRKK